MIKLKKELKMFVNKPIVKLTPVDPNKFFHIPSYASPHSSGMDIKASLEEDMIFLPLERKLVPTNLKIEIPPTVVRDKQLILGSTIEETGFYLEMQIRSKSGYSYKKGLHLTNGIGTIDSDYRGEIYVSMTNMTHNKVTIVNKETIAQIVLVPFFKYEWELTDELSKTIRDDNGFGEMTKIVEANNEKY